jgi:hypothetical protein
MERLWRWLWSRRYSKTATCLDCGAARNKAGMYHDQIYGWFCSKEAFERYWLENQI